MTKPAYYYKISKDTKAQVCKAKLPYRPHNFVEWLTTKDLTFSQWDLEADPMGVVDPVNRDAARLAADGFYIFFKENDNGEGWALIVHHTGVNRIE